MKDSLNRNVMKVLQTLKTLTHILLTIVIIMFIITGFGISQYQIIESLTGDILSKLTSYQIHSNLIIPLVVLLTVHIAFTIGKKFKKEKHL
jgi:phosphotransferase system  glucose/maltose/N-acetylglucosamine-specific IIC component